MTKLSMMQEKTQKKQPRTYSVKKQVVAGFIVYRRTEEGIKFLLLYRRGNYWNFPKGHFEEGERSFEAALRETQEETGIKPSDLRIVRGFRAYQKFSFYGGREKIYDTVILYLAETRVAQVTISPDEHSGFAWFTYADATRILGTKYVATKKVLKQAYDFIRSQSHRRGRPNPKG